jgi:tape measure domain-containing protein
MAENRLAIRLELLGEDLGEKFLEFGRKGAEAFKAIQKASDDVSTSLGGAAGQFGKLNSQLDVVATKFKQVGSNFSFLGGEVARVAGAIAGAFSVTALINATSLLSDLEGRLKNVLPASANVADTWERLMDVANRTYQPIDSLVDAFATSAKSMEDLGFTVNQSLDFFEALNNALVVSGARGVQAESVTRALTRALQDGALKGGNFQAVLDNGGRVLEVLADHLGVTVQELRKMASEGRITGEVIKTALIGSLGELRAEADGMAITVLDGLTRIRNAFLQWVKDTEEQTGVASTLAGALVWVADNFALVADAGIAVAGAFLAIKAVKLGVDIISLTASIIGLLPPLISLTVLLLTNPFGLAAIAILTLVAGILYFTGTLGTFIGAIKSTVKELIGFGDSAEETSGKAATALDKSAKSAQGVATNTGKAASAVGDLADNTGKFGKEASDAAKDASKLGTEGKDAGVDVKDSMEDSVPAVDAVGAAARRATEAFKQMAAAARDARAASGAGAGGAGPAPQANARGGHIRGRGTGTSDSILSWLSDGEYVVKARAVKKYGTGFLSAINGMRLPAFNMGGLASLPDFSARIPAFADGGLAQAVAGGAMSGGVSGRPLSLSIGDETFDGLIAPEDVATRLASYAASRQMRRAGKTPSWYKG